MWREKDSEKGLNVTPTFLQTCPGIVCRSMIIVCNRFQGYVMLHGRKDFFPLLLSYLKGRCKGGSCQTYKPIFFQFWGDLKPTIFTLDYMPSPFLKFWNKLFLNYKDANLGLNQWPSHLSACWDYRCMPPHQAYTHLFKAQVFCVW